MSSPAAEVYTGRHRLGRGPSLLDWWIRYSAAAAAVTLPDWENAARLIELRNRPSPRHLASSS